MIHCRGVQDVLYIFEGHREAKAVWQGERAHTEKQTPKQKTGSKKIFLNDVTVNSIELSLEEG